MGRKKYSKELKARIALDAIKGQKMIADVHPSYIANNGKQFTGK